MPNLRNDLAWCGRVMLSACNYQEEQVLRLLSDTTVATVCGPEGLLRVYAALCELGMVDEPPWLAAALAASDDPSEAIVAAAEATIPAALCTAALEVYVAPLGTVVTALALVYIVLVTAPDVLSTGAGAVGLSSALA